MDHAPPKRSWQFSLKRLLLTGTLIFLALPLLPFAVALACWYLLEPDGLAADIFRWGADRIRPRKKRKQRPEAALP